MAGYKSRPAPKKRPPQVQATSDSGFVITRDTTEVKPPSEAEIRRMKKLEAQRRRDTI